MKTKPRSDTVGKRAWANVKRQRGDTLKIVETSIQKTACVNRGRSEKKAIYGPEPYWIGIVKGSQTTMTLDLANKRFWSRPF